MSNDSPFSFAFHLEGNHDLLTSEKTIRDFAMTSARENAIASVIGANIMLERKITLLKRVLDDWSALSLDLLVAQIHLEEKTK